MCTIRHTPGMGGLGLRASRACNFSDVSQVRSVWPQWRFSDLTPCAQMSLPLLFDCCPLCLSLQPSCVISDGEWCLGEEWCLDSNSGQAALFVDAPDGLLPVGSNDWQCYDPETQGWAAAAVTTSVPGIVPPEAVPPSTAPVPAPSPTPAPAPAGTVPASAPKSAEPARPLRMSPAQRAAAAAARESVNAEQRDRELEAARAKFAELDADGSGSLDRTELAELAKFTLTSFSKSGGVVLTDDVIGTIKRLQFRLRIEMTSGILMHSLMLRVFDQLRKCLSSYSKLTRTAMAKLTSKNLLYVGLQSCGHVALRMFYLFGALPEMLCQLHCCCCCCRHGLRRNVKKFRTFSTSKSFGRNSDVPKRL